jgi:hypothetical protein
MRVIVPWLILGLAAMAAYAVSFPTYEYRYRLTIRIEVDNEVHSGSSVIDIAWIGQPDLVNAGPFRPRLRGQATFVDLKSHGAIIAALNNGESYGTASDVAINALWLAGNAFGNKSTNAELPGLPHLRGHRELAADNMPRLIWLRNPSDPKSARKIHATDIPTIFGPTARLVSATVEITQDPIVIDIDGKLSWLRLLADKGPGSSIQVEYGFALGRGTFIGVGP